MHQWSSETASDLFRTLHAAHRPERPTRFEEFASAEPVARALSAFQERHPNLTPVVAKRKLQDALRSASLQARAKPGWCMPGARPERKDHTWADLSNLALWAALIEGKTAGAKRPRTAGEGEEAVASSLASMSAPPPLVAKFDGMGDFEALASFEQLSPDTLQLVVPAPASVTPKYEAMMDADTNELRIWVGRACASVRLPRGVFPRRASVKREPNGPLLSMWRIRVQLAPYVPVELRLEM